MGTVAWTVVVMGDFDAAHSHERRYEIGDESHGGHGNERAEIVNGHRLPEADDRRQRDRQTDGEQRGDVDERADRTRSTSSSRCIVTVIVGFSCQRLPVTGFTPTFDNHFGVDREQFLTRRSGQRSTNVGVQSM